MLIVTGLPIAPEPTLTELDLGIVVSVNELPLILKVLGDQPPLPLKLADTPKDLLPSALCPTVIVWSMSHTV